MNIGMKIEFSDTDTQTQTQTVLGISDLFDANDVVFDSLLKNSIVEKARKENETIQKIKGKTKQNTNSFRTG
jgi:hypothetical protein